MTQQDFLTKYGEVTLKFSRIASGDVVYKAVLHDCEIAKHICYGSDLSGFTIERDDTDVVHSGPEPYTVIYFFTPTGGEVITYFLD